MRQRWSHYLSEVAPTAIWIVLAAALSVGLALQHSPLTPLPGVITLLVLPGATVLTLLQTRPAATGGRVVLAVCLSMMTIMVVGGMASLLGPHIGVAHPLDTWPEAVLWFILALGVLVVGSVKHCDPASWIFEGVRVPQILVVLASGVLPVLAILGVAQLNFSGNTHLAVISTTIDVAALISGVIGGWRPTSRWPLNTLLYSASLALILSTSLRGGHLYGWDIQKEFGVASHTINAGVWVIPANHEPFASMLSLTVLPAVLHTLTRLHLLAFFQLVVPAILALLPVAMFSAARSVPRWVNSGRRLLPRPGLAFGIVVGVVVSSVAFSSLLVSITRQAMAVTMFTAAVMVVFDRTMRVRPAQIVVGLLVVAIAFTHYSTAYMLAGIVVIAWATGWLWSQGWLGTSREKREAHRSRVRSRSVFNLVLVAVTLVSAFGWNLGVTRNDALANATGAFAAQGAKISASTQGSNLTAPALERLLLSELQVTDSWINPVPGSGSIHLVTDVVPSPRGAVPSLSSTWSRLNFLLSEGVWVLLGVSLLYGLLRLARRQSDLYSADLVGLGVAGLVIGVISRYSETLATLFSPERAAIFTAILLAVPATMFLDDMVTSLAEFRPRIARASVVVGVLVVVALTVAASGLGTLLFGGYPPGSLTANGVNAQQFTVSNPEVATAAWLRNHAGSQNTVQTDLFGQLVMLSEPGDYNLLSEIAPPGVDANSYVYLSTVNIKDKETVFAADNLNFVSSYRTTFKFFNRNFYVVYSNGATRVYH